MKQILSMVALAMLACSIYSSPLMDRFLDGIASVDVLPEVDPVPTTLLADYPGIALFDGVENEAGSVPDAFEG